MRGGFEMEGEERRRREKSKRDGLGKVSKQHGCSARGTLQCNASAMRSHISPAPQPVRSFETLRPSRTPPNSMSDQCEVLTPLPRSFEWINRLFGAGS
jgi:hypothetical protein